MAWDFDYEKAFKDWAKPEYDNQIIQIKDIVCEVHARLERDAPLDDLKQRLKELPREALAKAISVVYYAGHWGIPEDPLGKFLQGHGTYWQFTDLAKAAWIETRKDIAGWEDMYRKPEMKPKYWKHEEGTEYCNEELAEMYREHVATLLTVASITQCNHKPHPFCIGAQHFGDMYIDVHKAPCAMRGCNLTYEEHTSDRVLFLKLAKSCKISAVNEVLKPLVPLMKRDKIDGVAFVQNEFEIIKEKHETEKEDSKSDD